MRRAPGDRRRFAAAYGLSILIHAAALALLVLVVFRYLTAPDVSGETTASGPVVALETAALATPSPAPAPSHEPTPSPAPAPPLVPVPRRVPRVAVAPAPAVQPARPVTHVRPQPVRSAVPRELAHIVAHAPAQPPPEPVPAPAAAPTAAAPPATVAAPAPVEPVELPSIAPTIAPTERPTPNPILQQTERPTPQPKTEIPTAPPAERPTPEPTERPTPEPTERPTPEPTERPTPTPTERATAPPTERPAPQATQRPSPSPTILPSAEPVARASASADRVHPPAAQNGAVAATSAHPGATGPGGGPGTGSPGNSAPAGSATGAASGPAHPASAVALAPSTNAGAAPANNGLAALNQRLKAALPTTGGPIAGVQRVDVGAYSTDRVLDAYEAALAPPLAILAKTFGLIYVQRTATVSGSVAYVYERTHILGREVCRAYRITEHPHPQATFIPDHIGPASAQFPGPPPDLKPIVETVIVGCDDPAMRHVVPGSLTTPVPREVR